MADKKTAEAAVFTKAQLLISKKYAEKRDLISALLEDGKTYTADQADALIEKYLKGTVR